jgi:hypothetical protein
MRPFCKNALQQILEEHSPVTFKRSGFEAVLGDMDHVYLLTDTRVYDAACRWMEDLEFSEQRHYDGVGFLGQILFLFASDDQHAVMLEDMCESFYHDLEQA